MKKIVRGLAGCAFILILIYICFCTKGPSVSIMEQSPDWIKGKLILNTKGIKSISEYEPVDQYLCEFDFDADSILTTKVPTGSDLFEEGNTGEPIIIYPASNSYAWWDPDNLSGYHHMKWRSYYQERVILSNEGRHLQTKYEDRISDAYAPLAVLGSSAAQSARQNDIYLLQYGISEEGMFEIQLGTISTKADPYQPLFHKYASININEDLSFFRYDISEDGKIAWTRRVDEIYVSDGKDTFKLHDDEAFSSALCWIDSETLLYFADTTKGCQGMDEPNDFTLRLWHVETNTIEDAAVLKGVEFGLGMSPKIIAYDEVNECLALYCVNHIYEPDSILIYSLKTGEYFDFVPWQQDRYDANGELIGSQGLSDDGTLYYYPLDMMEPQLIWCAA